MLSILVFFAGFAVFSAVYGFYFVYLRLNLKKSWGFTVKNDFQPSVSILVPVHNEAENIGGKLENILAVSYPKDKIEVIVADDASDDTTLEKVAAFTKHNSQLNVRVFKQAERSGKAAVLNAVLPISSHQIVIVSDADTYWPQDILEKALPYLSDPTVGAVTGRGLNENKGESWVTKSEDNYLQLASVIRLGESKVHSTIRFEGGFCAYKKDAFEKFDCESGSDDSGTALDVVQNNYRAILVPEVVFYTSFPSNLAGKLKIKARRGNQLIGLWIKCFRLMLKRRLVLPKRIVLPEIALFIFNPLIFLVSLIAAVASIMIWPISFFSLFLVVFLGGLLIFARSLFLELFFDNLLLVYGFFSFILGRRYVAWKKTPNQKAN